MPKAKNHHIEPISGALKNWVGVVNYEWRLHNHGDPTFHPRNSATRGQLAKIIYQALQSP